MVPAPLTPESDERAPTGTRLHGFGWWQYDLRTGEIQWDARARQIFGLPGEGPLTVEQASSVIHPDDRELADAVLSEALSPGSPGRYTVRKRIVRDDGVHWVRTLGHVQYEDGPEGPAPARLVGVVEELEDEESAEGPFQTAIAGSDIILAHCDTHLRYTWIYNPDPHFNAADVIGRRDDELASAEHVAELMALKREVMDRDAGITRQIEIIVAGAPHYYSVHAAPLHGHDGAVIGATTAAADVTERVRAEDLAREASEAKSRLMSMISHELRTPLAGILGHAELLEQGVPEAIPERALEHVGRIRTGVGHMQALIDELLRFSRLQAGREAVSLDTTTAAAVSDEALKVVDGLARSKELGLAVEVEEPMPDLCTDVQKVEQVLVNLLGNAIKYTEEGSVTLRVERAGEVCLFHVVDTGIGIAGDHLDRVFEPFWRAPRASTGTRRGTGLGLAVAREIARLLHGEIEVESRPDEGSRFTLRVPFQPPGG